MNRVPLLALAFALLASAHDPITTKLTWTTDIVRIVYAKCGSCHRPGGSAPMSLLDYADARPWAKAIKEEVLERRMPPWGAVKGFGDFANDPSLTQEELHLIADWVEGGAPEGDPKYLPDRPAWSTAAADPFQPKWLVSAPLRLSAPAALGAVRVEGVPEHRSLKVVAVEPGGRIQPLLWLYGYRHKYTRTYAYREPVRLPAGTTIVVAPAGIARQIAFSEAPSRGR
ncbi:MAG: cytochrome c [Acidobacteria bacterium]|nr:cytochrome c [Acidobacteriota bacterium]